MDLRQTLDSLMERATAVERLLTRAKNNLALLKELSPDRYHFEQELAKVDDKLLQYKLSLPDEVNLKEPDSDDLSLVEYLKKRIAGTVVERILTMDDVFAFSPEQIEAILNPPFVFFTPLDPAREDKGYLNKPHGAWHPYGKKTTIVYSKDHIAIGTIWRFECRGRMLTVALLGSPPKQGEWACVSMKDTIRSTKDILLLDGGMD